MTARIAAFRFPAALHKKLGRLRNPLFWDQKVKIAVLTAATFLAMC